MTAAAPTPTPPPAYTPVEPSSSIQDAGSLPKEDLLALLSHYRGPSDDLKGLSVDDLQVLLSYHKVRTLMLSNTRCMLTMCRARSQVASA
jgi:hypothetical protein